MTASGRLRAAAGAESTVRSKVSWSYAVSCQRNKRNEICSQVAATRYRQIEHGIQQRRQTSSSIHGRTSLLFLAALHMQRYAFLLYNVHMLLGVSESGRVYFKVWPAQLPSKRRPSHENTFKSAPPMRKLKKECQYQNHAGSPCSTSPSLQVQTADVHPLLRKLAI